MGGGGGEEEEEEGGGGGVGGDKKERMKTKKLLKFEKWKKSHSGNYVFTRTYKFYYLEKFNHDIEFYPVTFL
jgi:hypothetical protein